MSRVISLRLAMDQCFWQPIFAAIRGPACVEVELLSAIDLSMCLSIYFSSYKSMPCVCGINASNIFHSSLCLVILIWCQSGVRHHRLWVITQLGTQQDGGSSHGLATIRQLDPPMTPPSSLLVDSPIAARGPWLGGVDRTMSIPSNWWHAHRGTHRMGFLTFHSHDSVPVKTPNCTLWDHQQSDIRLIFSIHIISSIHDMWCLTHAAVL